MVHTALTPSSAGPSRESNLFRYLGFSHAGSLCKWAVKGSAAGALRFQTLHLNIIVIITSSRPVRVDQGWHALRVQNHAVDGGGDSHSR